MHNTVVLLRAFRACPIASTIPASLLPRNFHMTPAPQLSNADFEIDQHGSPVALEPADWLVLFVPGLRKQWWHPFVHARHKHCFVMRPGVEGGYILVEPWWTRMMISTLTAAQARKFLLWGAQGDVLVVRENIPGAGSQVRGWMTCAALTAYLLGRSYPVWTPHGLYRRLLREPGVRRVNPVFLLQSLGAEHVRPHVHGVPETVCC
jgi:hypothetical protein